MTNGKGGLKSILRELSAIAQKLDLSEEIINKGNDVLKQIYKITQLRQEKIETKIAVSLYIACRQQGFPRTFREISVVSKITSNDIKRCFKSTLKAFPASLTSIGAITTTDYMQRFAANLNLLNVVHRVATHIATKAFEMDIVSGRFPASVVGAAIYMASQASEDKRSKIRIAKVTCVHPGTIAAIYKQMYVHAEKLFPQDFVYEKDMLPRT